MVGCAPATPGGQELLVAHGIPLAPWACKAVGFTEQAFAPLLQTLCGIPSKCQPWVCHMWLLKAACAHCSYVFVQACESYNPRPRHCGPAGRQRDACDVHRRRLADRSDRQFPGCGGGLLDVCRGRSAGWFGLAGWLLSWSVGQSLVGLVGWLVGCLVWLVGRVVRLLVGLVGWLVGYLVWLVGRVVCLLVGLVEWS